MKKKIVSCLLALGLVVCGFVGCGTYASTETSEATDTAVTTDDAASEDSSNVSGSISLAGSTSMEKLCEALMESFMEANPGVTVTAEYTGSGAGLESLAAGSVDIGNASRSLKDEEKSNGAVENIVAIDGIAVITDKNNTVTDISSEDLAAIYTGQISNWAEVGGEDEAIVVIGREAGSGTRDAFEELLNVADSCQYAQELDSTGAVLATVAATEGAIGYVSLDVVDDSITAMSIDGVASTEEEILAGNYLLQRPFVMATKGEISEQNETVQAWFDFINSDAGKNVITSVGLIVPQ